LLSYLCKNIHKEHSFFLVTTTLNSIVRHYLYPADLYVSKTPTRVTTLLGSCVAICLWDEALKIGGINHFLLPFCEENNHSEPLKFGNTSTRLLIKKMINLGCRIETLTAKVLGGAQQAENYYDTGNQNAYAAMQILNEENIRIIGRNIGGSVGRKLIFYTHSGEVFMKMLKHPTI